jgi:hypothetical protein
VWCVCVSLPRGACGRWEGICVALSVGVFWREGLEVLRCSFQGRPVTLAPAIRPVRFLGFLEDLLRPFPSSFNPHPSFRHCFSTTPKALFLQPPVLGGALLCSPRPAPRAILERSPADILIRRISIFFPAAEKERGAMPPAIPIGRSMLPRRGIQKNYNEALRCRFAWLVKWQDRKMIFTSLQ